MNGPTPFIESNVVLAMQDGDEQRVFRAAVANAAQRACAARARVFRRGEHDQGARPLWLGGGGRVRPRAPRPIELQPRWHSKGVSSKLEVEFLKRHRDHVRFDPAGARDMTTATPTNGGVFTLRLIRDRGVEVHVWTQLAYDIGEALNAAYWRREERRGQDRD